MRTSRRMGIATLLLVLTFSAGFVAQDATSDDVVPPGIYASHEKVAAAMANGGLLISKPDTPAAISVTMGHREKADVVEVHEKETDVFYVADGEATVIAGGTRIKSKSPSADNSYDVEGGKTFHL